MKLGILQLDTAFERLPGDAGNAASWPFPVQFYIMHGVTPDAVMQGGEGILQCIMAGVRELVESGVVAITTTCGFLVLQQAEIAARCPVPFISSSLLQLPMLLALLPADKTVGVLVSQADALTAAHWRAAGLPPLAEQRLHVAGFASDTHFIRTMRGQDTRADPKRLEQEVLSVAHELLQEYPDVGAIVSECANLPRYSALLRQQTQRAVFDVRTLVLWQMQGTLQICP